MKTRKAYDHDRMYVDEVLDYIERDSDRGSQLEGTWIPLLLYVDNIV